MDILPRAKLRSQLLDLFVSDLGMPIGALAPRRVPIWAVEIVARPVY